MSPIEFEKTFGEQNFKVVPMTEKRFWKVFRFDFQLEECAP